jgi:hypothetical protein
MTPDKITSSICVSGFVALCLSSTAAVAQTADTLLPPNAKAGECYARVYTPASETKIARAVETSPASERLEIVPATYRTVKKTVVVEPASEKLEVIPARYEDQKELVVVAPSKEQKVIVPAVYETVEERVLVQQATQVWKKGTGPIQRYDQATGEIMCLVTIPAKYETVKKRVLKTPARVETKITPPETVEITKRVMVNHQRPERSPFRRNTRPLTLKNW